MRDIKFRWYDKRNNIIYNNSETIIYKDGSVGNDRDSDHHILAGQFTGLHDVKGIEIYEGDILSHYSGNILIKYETDYCGFNICYQIHECTVMKEDIEVIGNIYENPELLNK